MFHTHDSIPTTPNQPKEATMQEPTQQPTTPAFDLNALLLTALAPVVQHMTAPLLARIAVLEEKLDNIKDASDERIKEIAEAVAEAAMYDHTSEYDHDQYDRFDDRVEEKINEAIDDLDMEDKLRAALRDMTFSITARY